MRTSLPVFVATLAAVAAGAPAALKAEQAGVAAAVNTSALGVPPDAAERVIVMGSEIYRDERIVTDAGGLTQVLFLDQSTLTIGPSSEVVIDQFVYDPDSGTGSLALNAAAGAFRFVGGQLSAQGAVTIDTPTATLGIRGSIIAIRIVEGGATTIIALAGEVTLTLGGETVVLQQGQMLVVNADGTHGEPAPADSETVAAASAGLEGDDSGGQAETIPTEDDVLLGLGDWWQFDTALGGLRFSDTIILPDPGPAAREATDQGAAAGREQEVAQEIDHGETFVPLSGRWFSTAIANQLSGWLYVDNDTDAFNRRIIGVTIEGGFLLVHLAPNSYDGEGNGGGDIVRIPLNASGAVYSFGDGSGTASPWGPYAPRGSFDAGYAQVDPDLDWFYVQAFEHDYPGHGQFFFGGDAPSPPFGTSIAAYSVLPDHILPSPIPFLRGDTAIAGGATSPLFYVPAGSHPGALPLFGIAALAISGERGDQRSVIMGSTAVGFADEGLPTLAGTFRGFSQMDAGASAIRSNGTMSAIQDGAGHSFYGADHPEFFALSPTQYFQDMPGNPDSFVPANASTTAYPGEYSFRNPVVEQTLPEGIGVQRTAATLNGYAAIMGQSSQFSGSYGVTNAASDPTNFTLTTEPLTNRVAASMTLAGDSNRSDVQTLDLFFGNIGPDDSSGIFIDDDHFVMTDRDNPIDGPGLENDAFLNGDPATFDTGILFTNAMVGLSELPGGIAACACEALTWGWWGYSFQNGDRSEVYQLGSFVAGNLLDLDLDLDFTGTVSYVGHAIGSVYNDGLSYVAAGQFRNTFDFSSRSGWIDLVNFDGLSFLSGEGHNVFTSTGTGPSYTYATSDPLVSTGGRMSLQVTGSFFSSSLDPRAATGGSFVISSLQGPVYSAYGTFAADQSGTAALDPPPPPDFDDPLFGLTGVWARTEADWTDFDDPDSYQTVTGTQIVSGDIVDILLLPEEGAPESAQTSTFMQFTLANGDVVRVPVPEGQEGSVRYSFGPEGDYQGSHGATALNTGAGLAYFDPALGSYFFQLAETASGEKQFLIGGAPTRQDVADVADFLAFHVFADHADASVIPFVPSAAGGDIEGDYFAVSPLLIAADQSGGGQALNAGALAALSISGEGAEQRSVMMGYVMSVFPREDGPFAVGEFRSFARPDAGGPIVWASGVADSLSSNPPDFVDDPDSGAVNPGTHIYGGADYAAFVLAPLITIETPAVAEYSRFKTESGAATDYGALVPALRTQLPGDVNPSDRQGGVRQGYAAALVTSDNFTDTVRGVQIVHNAGLSFGEESADVTDSVTFVLDPLTNLAVATFELSGVEGAADPAIAIASLEARFTGRSAFIDDQHFVIREAFQNPNDSGVSVNGANAGSAELVLLSSGMAPLERLPSQAADFDPLNDDPLADDIAPCTCAFLQWGWWGAEASTTEDDNDRRDLVHAGTWVAGEVVEDTDYAGTATYDGHVIASISDDGNQYIAAGSYRNVFDFAAREGQVSVLGLDGRDYQTGSNNVAGFAPYSTTAPILSNDGQVEMNVTGSFVSGPDSDVQGTIGVIDLIGTGTNPDYLGTGTFAAESFNFVGVGN